MHNDFLASISWYRTTESGPSLFIFIYDNLASGTCLLAAVILIRFSSQHLFLSFGRCRAEPLFRMEYFWTDFFLSYVRNHHTSLPDSISWLRKTSYGRCHVNLLIMEDVKRFLTPTMCDWRTDFETKNTIEDVNRFKRVLTSTVLIQYFLFEFLLFVLFSCLSLVSFISDGLEHESLFCDFCTQIESSQWMIIMVV